MSNMESDLRVKVCAPLERPKPRLRIGDFYPVSSTLYNGEPATEIFFQGCPWECNTCRSPHLIPPAENTAFKWQDILYYLMGRRGLINHVVFNGAEPLSQTHLIEAITQCKTLGFMVGLHTCGIFPLRLESVLPVIDWIWFEVLGLPEDYQQTNNILGSGEVAWECLQMAIVSGVPVVCEIFCGEDSPMRPRLIFVANQLACMGVEHLVLSVKDGDCAILADAPEDIQAVAQRFPHFTLRTAPSKTALNPS